MALQGGKLDTGQKNAQSLGRGHWGGQGSHPLPPRLQKPPASLPVLVLTLTAWWRGWGCSSIHQDGPQAPVRALGTAERQRPSCPSSWPLHKGLTRLGLPDRLQGQRNQRKAGSRTSASPALG